MTHTATDLVWIKQLFVELHLSVPTPVLFCDNKFAMALASNPVFQARTKHIEIYYHFIREQVLANHLTLQYIGSHAQIVDILTKGLFVSQFLVLKAKLKVGSPPLRLQGSVRE